MLSALWKWFRCEVLAVCLICADDANSFGWVSCEDCGRKHNVKTGEIDEDA